MSKKLLLFYAICSFASICLQAEISIAQQTQSANQLTPVQFESISTNGAAMIEDQLGYLWFGGGTNIGGLVRYDGYEFERYVSYPEDSTSLSDNQVESLYVDSEGILWVGTFGGGLNKFDIETQTFTHYLHDPEDPSNVSHNIVTDILEDDQGFIWIATHNGLYRFDKEKEIFKRYLHDPNDSTSLSHNVVRVLYIDTMGTLWVGTGSPFQGEGLNGEGGLNRFDSQTESFSRFMHDPDDSRTLINNKVMSIYEDSRGTFWVGTSGDGLHSMDRQTGQFTRHRFDPDDPTKISRPFLEGSEGISDDCIEASCGGVSFVYEDSDGFLWIGGFRGGVNQYNLTTGAMYHYEPSNSDLDGINVWTMSESSDGTLWIGTITSMYRITKTLFPHEVPNPSNTNDLVTFFHEEGPNSIWVGTVSSLIEMNSDHSEKQRFTFEAGNPDSDLPGPPISIHSSGSGELWVGYGNGSLQKINPRTGESTFLKNFQANIIIDIEQDTSGIHWISHATQGLIQYHPETDTYSRHTADPEHSDSLSSNNILDIFEDGSGTIWLGLDNGLIKIERSKDNVSFQRYNIDSMIVTIFEDREGQLWLGSYNDGLYLFDPQTGTTNRLKLEDKTRTSSISNILQDKNGNLWISRFRGDIPSPNFGSLSFYNVTNETMTHYSPENGLPNIGFFLNAALLGNDGRMYFGGRGGYTVFDPSAFFDNEKRSKMILTGLRVSNEEIVPSPDGILTEPIFRSQHISLSHAQNDITIDYKAFSFTNNEALQYRYTLENYDFGWINARNQQSARYVRVPPGTYTFKAQGIDYRGVESEIASIGITILHPWWRTWWAYGLYALIFAAGVFAVDRFQRRRLLAKEREQAREKELEQAKEIEKAYQNLEVAHSKLEVAHEDLKSAQEQLVQQEKLASLGQLTAGIAHEIKNPLNFVNNFSDLSIEIVEETRQELQSIEPNPKEALSALDDIEMNLKKIHEHGTRADGIVKSMLQHSRGGEGKMEPTPLNPLIKEYVNLAFHGMRAGQDPINVDIELKLDEGVGEIELIAEDFSRVILNLCNNAFDAMREKLSAVSSQQSVDSRSGDGPPDEYAPKLSIRTHKKDHSIIIEIQDNGPGIPDEIKDKILQPFFTTKKGTAGTGLGLSITHDIVKAHGGSLVVNSDSNGSAFVISMPG